MDETQANASGTPAGARALCEPVRQGVAGPPEPAAAGGAARCRHAADASAADDVAGYALALSALGKAAPWDELSLARRADGRHAAPWAGWDGLSLHRQLGALPQAGEGAP